MKKVFLLILGIFLLSGCSATYNLEIYNEDYKENISVLSTKADTTGIKDWNIPVNADTENIEILLATDKVTGIDYYTKKDSFNNSNYKYDYNHKFSMTNYYKSYFAVNSYDFFAVYYNDTDESGKKELITISTSLKNLVFEKYPELETLKVNIKTNHKVYSNNADSKKDYTYTWNITRDNYTEKPIQIRIYKDKYVLNYNNELSKKLYIFLIILGVLLLVMGIVFLRMRKANKI